ncbi:response regulator transcription factor [Georgenia subflava]|uniref:response regulator transcription factor n=1 Tax=Georgenia subflava TaxID=1622177 RepID=UPI001D0344EC|nr:response regulator transcription factor [Georgenia subflava]
MIRVVLADDQQIVRAGVARILGPGDGFEVVAECRDGSEVVAAVRASSPDLVVMDVRMPGVGGLEATRLVRAEPDPPPVLVLTTFSDDDVLWGALEAGAGGFVLKDTTATDLIAAARAVAAGAAWFDPAVTPRVLSAYRGSVAPAQRDVRRLEALSDRELEVLRQMARGATNREIAASLVVSEGTVKSHVGAIFTKLDVRDRAAAIVLAYDRGVVTPGG